MRERLADRNIAHGIKGESRGFSRKSEKVWKALWQLREGGIIEQKKKRIKTLNRTEK